MPLFDMKQFNYRVFTDMNGIYSYTYEAEKNDNCIACSQVKRRIKIKNLNSKLKDLIDLLCSQKDLQLKNPAITTVLAGKTKTLYIPNIPSIEEKTRNNLSKSLTDLGLEKDSEVIVADVTTPNAITFQIDISEK